jgi:hypothetical protein
VTAASEEQQLKAYPPIDVTPSGIVMAVREEHPQKAQWSIDVTESGIVMDKREVHPQKALFPIDVTPFAKVTADLGILGRNWEGFVKDERNSP